MKNAFIPVVVALAMVYFTSCKKCFQCHNQCEVCHKARHDTTLTILIESQNLTEQYYTAYIDSLQSPSVGWICNDTTSNNVQEFCGSANSNDEELNAEALGYICN